MMVSLSNGALSNDESNKQPLVNGYMTKWKPRKVSATRKFPPGCGRNVAPIDTRAEGNGASENAHSEANVVAISGAVEPVKDEENKNLELNDLVAVVEDKSFGTVSDGGSLVIVNSPDDEDIDASLDALVGKLTGSASGADVKTDATSNIPIQVEKSEPLGVLVGQVETMVDGLSNNVDKCDSSDEVTKNEGDSMREELNGMDDVTLVEKSSMEEEKPVSDDGAPVEKVLLHGRSNLLSSYVKPEFLMRLRDKCCRRKVSAVRNFPPNCGRNVSLRTEEEKQMVTSGNNDSLDSAESIEVEQELSGSKPVIDNSVQHAGLKLREKVLVSSPDGEDKVMLLDNDNDVTAGNDQQEEDVVHELMADPHCPWRKGKEALNNSDSGPSGGEKNQQKRKSVTVTSIKNCKEHSIQPSKKKRPLLDREETDSTPCSSTSRDDEDHGACTEYPTEITPISVVKTDLDYSNDDSEGPPTGKELVVYSHGESSEIKSSRSTFNSEDEDEPLIALISAPYSSPKKRKTVKIDSVGKSREKVQKKNYSWRNKAVAKKSVDGGKSSGGSSKKSKSGLVSNNEDEDPNDEDLPKDSRAKEKTVDFDVRLPPFGPNINSHGDARNKVRETLRLFHSICRKLLQREENGEAKSKLKPNRIDLRTASLIKEKGKEVNNDKQYLGAVPGVEVGDEFQYRVELAVVGIHRLYQAGIDWMKLDKIPVATSIVTSGAYNDDTENADVLIYSGQGGNIIGGSKGKEPEDQKLERGNLALSNSSLKGTPVRVVRGWKETVKGGDPSDPKSKAVTTYVYDGLYTVRKYWMESVGSKGVKVFKFELTRNPDQPELAWKELRNKSKIRPGVCVVDISGGKERFPICAVNIVNDEKPPQFNYISKMMFPDWYVPNPPTGCECVGRCGGSKKCLCAVRNGGEIPYNRNGAIVEAKPLVYECGPHCKCPPTCYNRVSQRGIKLKLEIFKTKSRGWGLRAATSIPSGSFICEYAGELLEDKDAEERIGNDEYLFDIGQNYTDSSLNSEEQALSVEITEEGGYTIDACQYGNVGRFVNHSCSPNLYAQNVVYDHDDKRMPHVMLFAAENIPPLQELTYHYNYKLDQVCDSNGNIKIKKCFCGSADCTGRLY